MTRPWKHCRRGPGLFPRDTELRFREECCCTSWAGFDEARQAYLDVLNDGGDERHFSSVDRALTGFKARQNLAVVASDMGDLAEAERQWREVVREVPRYRQGWRGIGETMLRAGRFAELDLLAENLTTVAELRVEGLLIKSRAAKTQGALTAARDALDRAATSARMTGPRCVNAASSSLNMERQTRRMLPFERCCTAGPMMPPPTTIAASC